MSNVNLLIFPEVLEGQEEATVKENLMKTLKVDKAKVDEWYLAEEPTILLQNVAEEVAERYEKAITNCGAKVVIAEPSKDGLSLVPKTKNKNTKLWICPECEHEEEIPRDDVIEQCPSCGLVMAKWEERMKEEAEKEKIRRRLLRDQRLKEDGVAEREARVAELERIKALEREIMKELGIKPPSQLWLLFEKYTVSLSFAFTAVIIMLTGLGFAYVDQRIEQMEAEQLAAAEPGPEIEGVAPVIGAAVQMQQTGNTQVMNEVGNVAEIMQGQQSQRQAAVAAAQQMMKGVDPEKFLAVAQNMAPMPAMSTAPPGGQPMPVNMDTIGGVTGLPAAPMMDSAMLASIAPPAQVDGRDRILDVLAEKRMIEDPTNPGGPGIVLEAIDEMDGSAIVDLMEELKQDLEWDLFMAGHVRKYMENAEFDKATDLAGQIVNPVVKIRTLGDIMADFQLDAREGDVKLQGARVRLDLDNVESRDMEAALILELGLKLGEAGSRIEPQSSLARVAEMASAITNNSDKAAVFGRLAVGYLKSGENRRARESFGKATQAAGRLTDPAERIIAFSKLAMRYYDARNLTLANEILAEADVLAATRVEFANRGRVFAEIAVARAYMGDMPGAGIAIDNAAEGQAREQVLGRVAQSLLEADRHFNAMQIIDAISDPVERVRLENRLLVHLMSKDETGAALDRLPNVIDLTRTITDPGDRGLQLSRLGRIAVRLGEDDLGDALFRESLENSLVVDGRKEQMNQGMAALEMGRVFWFGRANDIVSQLDDIVVRDPIGNEIMATERIVQHMLPEDLMEYEET